jgi:hypothetical protein
MLCRYLLYNQLNKSELYHAKQNQSKKERERERQRERERMKSEKFD